MKSTDKTILKRILKVIIIILIITLLVSPIIVFNIVRDTHDRDAEMEAKSLYNYCLNYLNDNYEYYQEFSEHLLEEHTNLSPDYTDVISIGYDPEIIFSGFTDIDIKNITEIEYSRFERSYLGYHFIEVSVLYTDRVPENSYEHIIGNFYGRYMAFRSNAM